MTSSAPLQHLVLIDGMSFLFRAFHAVRGNLSRADGLPTNALYGFSQMLIRVVDDLSPTHCAMVLDSKGKTFRHQLYPAYKANRPEPDPALIAQLDFLEPLVNAFGLPILRQTGLEADDLIATAVTHAHQHLKGARVTIVTSDKDLMQLVSLANSPITVRLFDTFKDKFIGVQEVHDKFGVRPDQVIAVQSLIGDSSDNVPGVPGIGPKTAANLLSEFETLDNLYANLDKVKNERIRNLLEEHKAQAYLSQQLVSLKTDCPLPPDHNLEFHPALHQAASFLRDTLEFRSLATRLEKRNGHNTANTSDNDIPDTEQTEKPNPTPRPSYAHSGHNPAPTAAAHLFQTPWNQAASGNGYQCIQTPQQWQQWLAAIRTNGWAAFDTETNSLSAMDATLVGLSFAIAPGQACYVPLQHGKLHQHATDLFASPAENAPNQLPAKQVLTDLKSLIAEGITLVAHNLKYDWQVIAHALGLTPANASQLSNATGCPLQNLFSDAQQQPVFHDTMLMSACLDGGRWGHSLDFLAEKHLSHSMIKYEDVCGKGKTQCTFDAVALDKATAYAAEDADATARLYLFFQHRFANLANEQRNSETTEAEKFGPHYVYEKIERPLLPVIVALESRGVALNLPLLHSLSADFAERLNVLEKEVHQLANTTFNLASPKQLAEVMFDQLGYGTDKQKQKKATGIEVLESLADDETNPAAQQFATKMMAYRQLSKLRSTYTEVLPRQVHPITQRVHTTYHQVGAATGRFSSADPNLQNIPARTEEGRKIRRAFIAAPGFTLISADYSQIELRLLAHFSGSQALRQAFIDGQDIHTYTAALVNNKPIESVSKDERRAAKLINFGLVYGMGARALAKQIGTSTQEAQRWIDAYFNRYQGVKEYLEATRQAARQTGYVETLFGRRIWLPDITSPNGMLRSNAERAAINAPLQGSNADIIKLAMPAVESYLQQHQLQSRTLMQVHDELVLEVADAELEQLKTALPQLMSTIVTLAVPLLVEANTAPNWDEAH